MRKGILKLKIEHEQLAELYRLYNILPGVYTPENDHEQLLLECAAAFKHRIEMFVMKEQSKYTFPVTSMEALAFLQLWQSNPMPVNEYGFVVLNNMIAKIDHKHKGLAIYG